jgi:hypothetical protein
MQMNVKNAVVILMVNEKTFLRRTTSVRHDIPRHDGSTKCKHLEEMHFKLSLRVKLGKTVLLY